MNVGDFLYGYLSHDPLNVIRIRSRPTDIEIAKIIYAELYEEDNAKDFMWSRALWLPIGAKLWTGMKIPQTHSR